MKIKSIKISNVLSFEHKSSIEDCQKIEFHNHMNILIGPNASGKSNFLEIINQIFRRILFINCNFNEANIDSNKTNPSQYPLYQTLSTQPLLFDLKKNNSSLSDSKEIELEIELNELDLENLDFVVSNNNDINRLFITYSIPNARPTFETNINHGDLRSYRKLTLVIKGPNERGEFAVSVKNGDNSSFFILEFLRYFQFVQYIILIANKYESKNWPPLKSTFALISGYRNYNKIGPVFQVTRDKNTQLQEIFRKVNAESFRLASNDEPAVFDLVKHKLAYRYSDILYAYSQEMLWDYGEMKPKEVLAHDTFFSNINNLLRSTLNLNINLDQRQYSTEFIFGFRDGSENSIDVVDLSAGEKGVLHLIFSLYGYELLKGTMIVDEPELHIHPQMQRRYLEVIEKAKEQLDLQFIFATHSPVFVNHETIKAVCRFYKDENNFTKIIRPEIEETDKELVHILSYTNSSKIFFSNKVILVEGPSDEYFYRFFLDRYGESKNQMYTDLEILNIAGKNNYRMWKHFLKKYRIRTYYIGDSDNLSQFIKIEPETQKERFDYEIEKNYSEGIFLLREGELEDYVGINKGLDNIIGFCENEFTAWFESQSNVKKDEIVRIFDKITETNAH